MKLKYHFLPILILLLALPIQVEATSGTCSYHGGVDCSAGADSDGSVICNDGWTESTVLYSEMSSCSDTTFSPMVYYMNLSYSACPNTTLNFTSTAEKYQKYKGIGYSKLADCMSQNNNTGNSAAVLIQLCGGYVQTDEENSYKKAYEEISAQCKLNTSTSSQPTCGLNAHQVENNKCECNTDYAWANTDPNNTDCVLVSTAQTTKLFTDLKSTDNFYFAIEYLKENGIIEGYDDGSFRPNNKINRAEFTKIVINSINPNTSGGNCFPDVKNEWFAPYICSAKILGIISGYSDGNFKPNNNINAAEALKITLLAFNKTVPPSEQEWYLRYYNYAIANHYSVASWGTALQEITRAEMAQLIYNLKTN